MWDRSGGTQRNSAEKYCETSPTCESIFRKVSKHLCPRQLTQVNTHAVCMRTFMCVCVFRDLQQWVFSVIAHQIVPQMVAEGPHLAHKLLICRPQADFPFLHCVCMCVCVSVLSACVNVPSSPCQQCADRLLARTTLSCGVLQYARLCSASSGSSD